MNLRGRLARIEQRHVVHDRDAEIHQLAGRFQISEALIGTLWDQYGRQDPGEITREEGEHIIDRLVTDHGFSPISAWYLYYELVTGSGA